MASAAAPSTLSLPPRTPRTSSAPPSPPIPSLSGSPPMKLLSSSLLPKLSPSIHYSCTAAGPPIMAACRNHSLALLWLLKRRSRRTPWNSREMMAVPWLLLFPRSLRRARLRCL
ncbi:UNVERIFIED_CONTAM: hypothetical protein Sradi_0548400 [Sesamum radiatum]|uniref:Uncharacterized protein n=1 Tax=Sesamum radiatum TaxID=300843 RepID=A0AAW2VJQ2_SESRA